jgi:hypothetical protein
MATQTRVRKMDDVLYQMEGRLAGLEGRLGRSGEPARTSPVPGPVPGGANGPVTEPVPGSPNGQTPGSVPGTTAGPANNAPAGGIPATTTPPAPPPPPGVTASIESDYWSAAVQVGLALSQGGGLTGMQTAIAALLPAVVQGVDNNAANRPALRPALVPAVLSGAAYYVGRAVR